MNVSLNLFKIIPVEKLANRLGTHIVEMTVSVSFCILFESQNSRMDSNISLLQSSFQLQGNFLRRDIQISPPNICLKSMIFLQVGHVIVPCRVFLQRKFPVASPDPGWRAVQVTYSAPVSSKLSTAWQLTEELLGEEVRRKIQLGFSEKKFEGDGGYPP